MKIPVKLPRYLVAGALALSLLATTPGLLPTQQAVAGEGEKIIITKDEKLVITNKVGDIIADAEDDGQIYDELVSKYGPMPDTREEYLKKCVNNAATEMANVYPKYEIIAINGKPWQETKWADLIKSHFMAENTETGWVAYPPPLRELIFDPRLNGKGFEIKRLIDEGKTADEVRAILLKDQAAVPTTDQKDIAQKPAEETTTVPNTIQAKDYQLVLTVGRKDGSEIKDGVNRQVVFDTAPEIIEETTMVPLRGVVDKFGADIAWDNASGTATVKMGDKTVTVQVNSKKATANGKETTLTVPPVIKNGRVLIPLRFISQGIGLEVNWDNVTRSIILKQPKNSTNEK